MVKVRDSLCDNRKGLQVVPGYGDRRIQSLFTIVIGSDILVG